MGREMTDEEKREYDQLTANMEQMRLRLEELTEPRPAIYGYARVSTYRQARDGNSLEAQEAALKAAGATEIFIDKFTGTKLERPQFEILRSRIRAGDTLVVTKLDRFARTVGRASELITELIDNGVTVHVLNLGVLDNSSMSTLMRNVLLSFSQFERDMIVERTQEGKAIARQREGFKDGRPKKYSVAQIEHALELLQDHSYAQVVDMTGISRATLAREKQRRLYKEHKERKG